MGNVLNVATMKVPHITHIKEGHLQRLCTTAIGSPIQASKGNPVRAGNCPATVKGTNAVMPLSGRIRTGRSANRSRQATECLMPCCPESGNPQCLKTIPFEGRGDSYEEGKKKMFGREPIDVFESDAFGLSGQTGEG